MQMDRTVVPPESPDGFSEASAVIQRSGAPVIHFFEENESDLITAFV
jgi:hypothetical protein